MFKIESLDHNGRGITKIDNKISKYIINFEYIQIYILYTIQLKISVMYINTSKY